MEIIITVEKAFKSLTYLSSAPRAYSIREMEKEDYERKNHNSGFSFINNPCEFIVGFVCGNDFISFSAKRYFSDEEEHTKGETFRETISRICTNNQITHLVVYKSDHRGCYEPWEARYVCEILSIKTK
jgi:hypothetical protein